MIEVQNLRKEIPYSRQQRKELNTTDKVGIAVQDLNFTCRPGRVFSLLGPNGAGKTTTLRMIATILKPTRGTIRVNGFDVVQQENEVRASIGFLTGSTGLYPRLTPNEIITYFGNLYQLPPDVLKARKEKLFTLLAIHDFANKRIGQLSTGMKQKVSIARTMIHDPQVVVFDEPTSGIDVITARAIIDLIQDCRAQQKTVIFSSHIMSEVELLCDDMAIIHKGRLLYNGSFADFRAGMKASNITEEFIRVVTEGAV